MSVNETDKLLRRVASRQRLGSFGKRIYWCTLASAAVYAVVLVCGRVLSLTDEWYELWTLGLIPLCGITVAWLIGLFVKQAEVIDAAYEVDRHAQTKDLFLTSAMIDGSRDGHSQAFGEYQPLVVDDAEKRAVKIDARRVVVLSGWRYVANVVVAMAIVAAGVMWLPRLDPFGNEDDRQKLAQQEAKLKKDVELTINRANQLAAKQLKAKHSKSVEAAIKDLKFELDSMTNKDQKANMKKLMRQQQKIGQMWRKAADRRLSESLQGKSMSQRFGDAKSPKMQEMEKQLKQGDTSGMKKELDQIKDLVNQLANSDDPAQQQQLQQEIEKRLEELSKVAQGEAGSKKLNEALQRALEQMKMAEGKGLSQELQKTLQQSLDLSKLEMEQLGQNARDIEALQKALEALQQAKACSRCNKLGEGEGEGAGQGGNAMQDYIDMYNEMLKDMQQPGEGGMGGPGRGKGGVAPENPDQKNQYKTEKSQAHLKKGKILAQWKTRGISEAGEADKDYQQAVTDVKEGVSEAMLQEQIPPGYHESIRKYFDNIEVEPQEVKNEATNED